LVSNEFKRIWWSLGHKWLYHSGPEWTLSRMKELSTYLIGLKAEPNLTPPPWWKRSHLKYLQDVTLSGSDEKFIQALQVVRSWTLFLGKERLLSVRDIEAFRANVERTDCARTGAFQKFFHGKNSFRRRKDLFPEGTITGHLTIKQPVTFRSEEFDMAMSAIEYAEFNGCDLPSWLIRLRIEPDVSHGERWPFGYVDHRIQSDGKVRWFYAAPPWQNEMLAPFSRALYQYIRSIPEDHTYNQESGVNKVFDWIKQGETCYSIDLSAATDSFPWTVTKQAIATLSVAPSWKTFISLYESLVLSPGAMIRTPVCPHELTHVTWTKGQPLGSQASFAMFALSHHYVVRKLFSARGLDWKDQYVILGDDIVLKNRVIAGDYRDLMSALGVDISESKSVSSPRVAEFAGRVILKDMYGFKFKAFHVVPENLHSAISILGARAIRACKPSFARNALALIPQQKYFGTNPGGFPFDKVVRYLTQVVLLLKEDHSEHTHDMYATKKQVAARHAAIRWNIDWSPDLVSKDLNSRRFHDDPISGIEWKWKPFLKRKVYSRLISLANQILK
jgi:hypothetical protein